ncbi:MAG: helix-turn-helix transcriptional regulator [Anaerolineaceae bacterium]|nr:helix-turn-helix transcriptional regulator [Anaerolineaceae bacterium]
MVQEPDMAAVAALIGEPTRAIILSALLGGEALPASELAFRAQVTPQTASSHLSKLLEGNLLKVATVGRHRYYSLKNHAVAQTLESLQVIAPLSQPGPLHMPKISPELCHARTCYDHLAGRLGVTLTEVWLQQTYLIQKNQNYEIAPKGIEWLESWKIDVELLKKKRRKLAYACLDWSERRFHIAGSLGAALADLFFENGWIKRLPQSRALKITAVGENLLKQEFGIALPEAQ